ncbi:unnamed protein product [Heligmosomoides polygyrus]|uniref:CUB domain-containing protein n=1 Tax=Heligmosomoides polygyrus TaxID=6339 RepID=A0A183GMI0_HELPZ|nr:unnamed protein product [Heligmosomoides polygyrus]
MWKGIALLQTFFCCFPELVAVMGVEPSIGFFDGNDHLNQCRTRLERRITGLSGVLYSHSLFGRMPYNASRNCFLMLIAPIGYRVRVRVVEFDVNGRNTSCEKDTLHVFDHETAIDPSSIHLKSGPPLTPGPIIGQFCGRRTNTTELSVSTMNALTLWWHTDALLSQQHPAKGFHLHWNAFRVTAHGMPSVQMAGLSHCTAWRTTPLLCMRASALVDLPSQRPLRKNFELCGVEFKDEW